MKCPTCSTETIKSYMLLGDEFDYCRTCKKEVIKIDFTESEMLEATDTLKYELPSGPPKPVSRCFADYINIVAGSGVPVGPYMSILVHYQKHLRNSSPVLITYQCWEIPPNSMLRYNVLEKWLPSNDLSKESLFYGIDRKVDRVKFAGVYEIHNTSMLRFSDTVVEDFLSTIVREGGTIDTLVMNPLGLFGTHFKYNNQADGSYTCAGVQLKVIFDKNCLYDHLYAINMNTWANDLGYGIFCDAPHSNGVLRLI